MRRATGDLGRRIERMSVGCRCSFHGCSLGQTLRAINPTKDSAGWYGCTWGRVSDVRVFHPPTVPFS
jgi:hypothetical protein